MGIFAAPSYLKKYGSPNNINDLLKHTIVSYGESSNLPFPGINWLNLMLTRLDSSFRPGLEINNVVGMVRAVESGVGIAALPTIMVRELGECEQILSDLEGPPIEAFFVYPESLKNVARLKVFRNFLYSKISEWKF